MKKLHVADTSALDDCFLKNKGHLQKKDGVCRRNNNDESKWDVLPSISHVCTAPSISRNCAVALRENQQVVER